MPPLPCVAVLVPSLARHPVWCYDGKVRGQVRLPSAGSPTGSPALSHALPVCLPPRPLFPVTPRWNRTHHRCNPQPVELS